jgi:hypothetical protein
MEQYKLNQPGEEYRLNTGDRLVLKDNLLFGFEFVYAGKSADDKFSLLCTEREFLSRRMQGSLFFPINQKNLLLNESELEVMAVNEGSISLKHIK